MKFGFHSPYLDTYGGGERYMLTLASYLSRHNQVEIFWDDSAIKPPLSRFLKIDLAKTKFVHDIFKDGFVKKTLEAKKYDSIFVLSDGSIPTLVTGKNILHFQVPFKFNKPDFKTKIKLNRFKWVIVNSNFTKYYIDRSFEINSKVIYPPVDLNSLRPRNKEKIILTVGRFSQNQLHPKKQEVLIEVFKELQKKAPGWKFILAGQAKKEDQKYIRKLKKQVRGFAISIAQNTPNQKLRELYGKAAIYWHATGFGEDGSKYPERMEHFGISTVEASASGAVPVVIEQGGQKEIVTDGKNGRLWKTKAQLLEITLDLINDEQKREKIAKAAILNSKRFSNEIFIKEYEKILF